jgi:hypothetical protein
MCCQHGEAGSIIVMHAFKFGDAESDVLLRKVVGEKNLRENF